MVNVDEIVFELQQLGEPRRVAALRRSGASSPAFGVALPALRSMAKRIGPDHRLASELWGAAVREARILATLIDEPERVTRLQMDRWATSFDSGKSATSVARICFGALALRSPRRSRGRDDEKSS